MIKRLPFILLAWILADIYFFRAVETLTNNEFILWAYWLVDLLIAAGFISLIVRRSTNRPPGNSIALLMGLTLLVFVPKILALPVLLLEDITRLFRHFPAACCLGKPNGRMYRCVCIC